jgi:hypothetical protein
MSRRPIWQTLFERFDPERPADEPAWRAPRTLSPAEAISEALDRPFGTPRVLLTGTIGTGKTTELYRIAEERAPREFVVYVDLERHFSEVVGDTPALQNVASWEVCFLAGLALLRAAEERLAFRLPGPHLQDIEQAWSALAKATGEVSAPPKIELGALAKSMIVLASKAAPFAGPAAAGIGAGLGLLGAAAEGVKWTLPLGIRKRSLPDQDQQMQTMVRCVNVIIGLVEQHQGDNVLLIIDGLDRIRDFKRARELFIDSTAIAQLACRMVVCGPFALRHHPSLPAIRGFTDVPPLVNEPVLLQSDPSQQGPGVRFFCDLFQRRVADMDAGDLIDRELLERLAYYSGGRARDFVTSVQVLAGRAWSADAPRATEELVRKVLDELRRKRETGLHRGHKALLRQVMDDPEHSLPEGDMAQELLSYGTLLPYPNESEWYYPHPLLTMRLLRPSAAGSGGSRPPSG